MNRSLNRPPGPPLRLDEAAAPAALLAVLGAVTAALGVVRVAAGAAAPPGLAVAGAVTWWAAGRWARVGDPARSLARRRDYADMSGRAPRPDISA